MVKTFDFSVMQIFCNCLHQRTKLETVFCHWQFQTLGLSQKDNTDSQLLWKCNLESKSENICWSFDSLPLYFPLSFPPVYVHLFWCTILLLHFSLTVSSNPSHCRWCPWKGGPLLNLWLLWSPSISSSAMQSIIPLLYSLSHLLPSPLISCSPPTCSTSLLAKLCYSTHHPPHFSILSVVSSSSLIQ